MKPRYDEHASDTAISNDTVYYSCKADSPATKLKMATPKVPAVSTISSLIRRLRLLSSSMLMYSSVSLMNSPAAGTHKCFATS